MEINVSIPDKSPFKAIALDEWDDSEDLDLSGLKAAFVINPEQIMENSTMLNRFKTIASKCTLKGVYYLLFFYDKIRVH